MKIEATDKGRGNIVLSKTEWIDYGRSMGWPATAKGVKTASAPSIKIAKEGNGHVLSMNQEGWMSIGKRAGFYDDDLENFNYDTVDGDDDYLFDGDDRSDPMNFDDEPRNDDIYEGEDFLGDEFEEDDLLDDELADLDVEESDLGKADATEEAMEDSLEALSTALYGIENGEVPPQVAPQLILSALEPMSEFRDIDTQEDPVAELSDYLESPPQTDGEIAVMDAIRNALDVAGIELDGGVEL